jgi:hypothetical protein
MQRVDSGESFHIDFEKRNMKVGKDFLIKNGEYDQDRQLIGKTSMENILSIIEELYHSYKYSLPSERSDKKRRKYFKALSIDELTDRQLMIAVRREGAQARLEGFILCHVLSGQFEWTDNMGNWFWQSKNDPDLVILRKWIKNN